MHVAICGELGAGCTEIGQILSKRLGMKCISSSDIIKSIVLDFRESFEDFEERVRSGEVDLDRMIDGKTSELLELGDTIVEGRSGFMLLDDKYVFKVLLVAPQKTRIEHIAERRNITVEEAREAIRVSDSERRNMVERLFRKEWLDPHNYDIVINTGLRSHKETADLIIKALPRKPASL